MFTKILIANRGAIASRIIRTCKRIGVATVAVYTEADVGSLHINEADEAICIGESRATETYLNQNRIIEIARDKGVQAIHPGYGFLSENTDFAELCSNNDIVFIGPRAEHIKNFGLKHTARELARNSNVPMLPGTGLLAGMTTALDEAESIGYPVMLKSTAGGGGIGMRLCANAEELAASFSAVTDLGKNNFGDGGVFLERYVSKARHIEVQVFGNGRGKVIILGERDCSLQRRHQKVIEETPAPMITEDIRQSLYRSAQRLCESVSYRSAGTVEFLYDPDHEEFYFLEVNTRLQVEHGVTEQVTGTDLVEWMICLAAGDDEFISEYHHQPVGHAIQARIYAENPGKNFQPDTGVITDFYIPSIARCETWVSRGTEISPYYDPMIAKVIVTAHDRQTAIDTLGQVLNQSRCEGLETNLEYLRQILRDRNFNDSLHSTHYLDSFNYKATAFSVTSPGTHTMIQDYPGRTGYWNIGIPPSGAMDSLSFRLGNRLLDNEDDCAGLEILHSGPILEFHAQTQVTLAGAPMNARLNGSSISFWTVIDIEPGDILETGNIESIGARSYLLIKGGISVADYLGSKSTFTLGQMGGKNGAALKAGDVLHFPPLHLPAKASSVASELLPVFTHHWEIRVVYGPHGAPDFFTQSDIEVFFSTDWEVHFNSNRTGIRLIGPTPDWARDDGGEAGLHPSNIHDNAYAVGTIDYTGDMPVILGPDGPSLGGFVCPATIIKADLWKIGQLKPGDQIRFSPITTDDAQALENDLEYRLRTLQTRKPVSSTHASIATSPVIISSEPSGKIPAISYRPSGEDNILIEYGPMELDLNLRFRVHAMMKWISEQKIAGILELTPGIRSLQVHYDSLRLGQRQLLDILLEAEAKLGDIEQLEVPTRIVYLPLSWDDESTRLAIRKYTQSVRPDAPWCPSNIEFIRRINGLKDIQQVKDIVFNASYLVLGLGDVYLGAPVATPVDPRHRLVTTKYNPARTWTPENAVGIGGAYLCVYGMEGPGGYQFVGRTLQMWNRYRDTPEFRGNKRWLLDFFDQIRFFPVSNQELTQIRRDFPYGRYPLKIEHDTFKLAEYNRFLQQNSESIESFKHNQQASFDAERKRWEDMGLASFTTIGKQAEEDDAHIELAEYEKAVLSQLPGSVWKINVECNEWVEVGQSLLILESMKMEFHLQATHAGKVSQILIKEGDQVDQGQELVIIEMENF